MLGNVCHVAVVLIPRLEWNTPGVFHPVDERPAISHLHCPRRAVRASIRMEAGSSVNEIEAARAHNTAYEYLCHIEETRS